VLKCDGRLDLLTSLNNTWVTSWMTFTFRLGLPMNLRRYLVFCFGCFRQIKKKKTTTTSFHILSDWSVTLFQIWTLYYGLIPFIVATNKRKIVCLDYRDIAQYKVTAAELWGGTALPYIWVKLVLTLRMESLRSSETSVIIVLRGITS
jgi:hypothetical protein